MPNADFNIIQDPERLARLRGLCLLDTPNEPAFDRLTRLTKRILNVPTVLISLVDADRQFFKSQIGFAEPWASARGTPMRYSFCQHVVASADKLIIDNAPENELVCDNPSISELNIMAYAGIPLTTSDGYTVGAMCVIDVEIRHWTNDEIAILEDLAASVMTEIELRDELNIRAKIDLEIAASYTEQERLVNQLTLLRRVEHELSDSLSINDVLMMALDIAVRFTRADNAVIALLDGEALVVTASMGSYTVGERFDMTRGVTGRAVRLNTPQFIPDVTLDPDYHDDVSATKAIMVIPLDYRDRVIGAISLESSTSNRFSREDFNSMSDCGGGVTSAIDNAQLYELSQQQLSAMHDLYTRISDLEQLKSDMIRMAAHDLRNPLSGVKGFAELLLREPLTDTQHAYIEIIQDSSRRMEKIITDILSLERIDALVEMKDAPIFDLRDLVAESYHDQTESALSKGLDYKLSMADEPICVRGDRPQLREAVDNLVVNAIKYTPENGSVFVQTCLDGGKAIVRVKDTGIGVMIDQQERLFQPFFRAYSPEMSGIAGTGLGLHLVKKIVERHHGQMIVESVYQQGSTFGFELSADHLAQ